MPKRCVTIGCHDTATELVSYDWRGFGEISTDLVCEDCAESYSRRPILQNLIRVALKGSCHVKRTRISEEPVFTRLTTLRKSAVRFSNTFRTATSAKREADAWNETGEWQAVVLPGRAPRKVEV